MTLQILRAKAIGNIVDYGFQLVEWEEDKINTHPE